MPSQTAENPIVRATEAELTEHSSLPVPSVVDFAGFLPPVSNTTSTPNQFFDVCLPHCSRSAIRVVAYFLRRTLGRGGSRNSSQRLNYDCDFWGWPRCSFRSPPLIASWRRPWNRALPALPCACALSTLWLTLAFRWAFRLRGGAPQCGYHPFPSEGTWSVGAGDLNRWSVGFRFLSTFKCRHM